MILSSFMLDRRVKMIRYYYYGLWVLYIDLEDSIFICVSCKANLAC